MRTGNFTKTILLIVAFATFATGCASNGVIHSKVVPASYALQPPPELEKIAPLTAVRTFGGKLYVAGCDGIAALDGSGKVEWLRPLPTAAVRLIEADADGVAFTSFNPAGVAGTGLKSILFSNLMEEPKFDGAKIGMLTPSGEVAWTVDSSEQSRLSPPALTKTSVGVVRTATFAAFDRKDGKPLNTVSMYTSIAALTDGIAAMSGCVRPYVLNDTFYASHLYTLSKIDATGKEIDKAVRFGLFTQFENITAGPVPFKGKLLFGNNPDGDKKRPFLFAATPDLKEDWDLRLSDLKNFLTRLDSINRDVTAPSDIVSNSDTAFVGTNFIVYAFNEKGDMLWGRKNEKGGLYPGSHRGVRFPKSRKVLGMNIDTITFSFLKAPGAQMVATDRNVYIVCSHAGKDALTVLDAKTGDYVQSIALEAKEISDMTLFNGNIALATTDGLKFVKLAE